MTRLFRRVRAVASSSAAAAAVVVVAPAPARVRRAPRLDRMPFGLHLMIGGSSVELFPPGPLDPLVFHHRHHDSLDHELEYVVAVPEGSAAEDYRAHAVFRLRPESAMALIAVPEIEGKLRRWYGRYADLPPARTLLERPAAGGTGIAAAVGLNRVTAPLSEKPAPGRFDTLELLEIARRELTARELVSWLEEAFSVRPPRGRAEHRYYLDAGAGLWLVRDQPAGKTLYRAEASAAALRPERRTGR